MNLPIIGAVDPNATFAGGELAIVVRAAQDLQNKHLTLGKLGQTVDDLHRAVLDLVSQTGRAFVIDDQSYAKAGALLKAIKNVLGESEEERKKVTGPVLELKGAVDTMFKALVGTPLDDSKKALEKRMLDYAKDKQRREAAAAQAERERIEAEAARQAKLAEAMDDPESAATITAAAKELVADIEPKKTVVESHGVKTQITTRKQVNVEDLKKALEYILQSASADELAAITSINSKALTSFVKRVAGGGELSVELKLPGLKIVEIDGLRNF